MEGGAGDCGELVGYVDDGAYSYAHRDPLVLSQVLSRKYVLLEDWINGNRLVINPDKTHLMVMGSKRISEARSKSAYRQDLSPSNQQKLRNYWEVTCTSPSSGTTTSETVTTPSLSSSPAG